jgi:hypothetical protein
LAAGEAPKRFAEGNARLDKRSNIVSASVCLQSHVTQLLQLLGDLRAPAPALEARHRLEGDIVRLEFALGFD